MQGEERTRRFLTGDHLPSIFETEMMRKDGNVVPVEARTRPIRDKDGKPLAIQGIYRDITTRRQQTEELRGSKERLALIFNRVSDLIFLMEVEPGPRFRFIAANSSLLRVTGLSEEKVLGHVAEEFFPEAEAEAITENYKAALQAREPITYEEHRNLLTGQLSFETTLTPLIDEHGRCTHVLGTSHGITARKRAEEALRESEERYRNLFENANDAIAVVDLNRTIVRINRAMEQLLGWSREELVGQSDHKVLTPAGIALAEDRERRIRNGEKVPSIFEHEFVRKDGRKVLVEGRTRFVRDKTGKPAGFQGIYRDISTRKQAEEALQKSEERYRGLVESQQDLIVRIDPQGQFTFVNDAYCKKFAKRREELIGKPFMPLVHEDDLAATLESMKGLEVSPHRVSFEQRALTAEGWRWIAWEDYAIRDEHGQTVEIQAVGRDITDRKQAQAEKEKLQEQLFQARKLEALGTLAGGVAHDFNNILSSIMGFTELATDEVPEGTLARRNLEEVLKASRRAKTLVQQILIFSRPSQQTRQSTQPQPIIEEVLTFLRASLSPTIEIHSHLDQTAEPVAISATQLQQVLTNLCANAIQALGERGGVVEIRLQRTDVEDNLTPMPKNLSPGPYMKITVRDTGCGMPPTIQERIFEPFFTTRPVGEGNGLGLAIVHGIVIGHGGRITVNSTPGEGTTFEVYLPASTNEGAPANVLHPSSPPAETHCGGEKGALSGAMHFSH